MRSPTKTEIDLIQAVNAHLSHLTQQSRHNVEEASLRAASGALRFLLVEDNLIRAWKLSNLGGAMTFKTWCIVSAEGNDVLAYCGGGDILPGIPFSACHNAKLEERTLNLVDFRKRPRIQVGTVTVSTVELIQYVANTLGGAHFDPEGKSPKSRKPSFNLLRRLEAGEFGGFISQVNGRNLLHHEVLSITQTVVRSPQVAELMQWRAPTSNLQSA
jgi:hypothetical protein